MAKRFKRAMVTYNGGLSYEFRGTRFRQGRSVPVTSEVLAKALNGKKGFSVQMEYMEVADEATDAPVAKPVVKKTKRVAADAD